MTRMLLVVLLLWSSLLQAQDIAESLFANYKQSVYRVDVVNPATGRKTTLGTGFVFGRNDLLASNFHVVSEAIHTPEQSRLEWQSVDGRRGLLHVVAVDVVHDLSLLKAEGIMGTPFITAPPPSKGVTIYSLGHPLGLDLAIVSGTSNGLLEHALYDKIHFSGNLNPGMSGGPAIDSQGRVVGVNVSSAGNAVSFLVPAQFLDALVRTARSRNWSAPADFHAEIASQLFASQNDQLQEFLSKPWPTQRIGKFDVPGEISTRIDCWSEQNEPDDDNPYRIISSTCSGDDVIFLSDRLSAGQVSYEFFWFDSDSLSPSAFYNLYENHFQSYFQSGAEEKDVGNFTCSIRFVAVAGQSFKANVCARPYKQYPKLMDFMVLMAMTGHDHEGLMVTMDLSTVTLDHGLSLLGHLLEQFAWHD